MTEQTGTGRSKSKKKECSHLTYYVYLKTLWTNKGEFGAHFEPIVQALDSAHLFIAYEQCNCDGLVYSWTLLQWNKNQIVMFGSLPLIEATMLVIMNIGRPSQRRNNVRIFDVSSVPIVVSGRLKNAWQGQGKSLANVSSQVFPIFETAILYYYIILTTNWAQSATFSFYRYVPRVELLVV